ncbi:hypothetical protein ACFLZP_02005 [Patescibacteria group bacterium]
MIVEKKAKWSPNYKEALRNALKFIPAVFGLAFLITSLSFLLAAFRYRQELRKFAGEVEDRAVLAFSQAEFQINDGDALDVEVRLDTDGVEVDAVDLVMYFNKHILELKRIVPNNGINFKTFLPLVEGTEYFVGSNQVFLAAANQTGEIEVGAARFDLGDSSDPDDGDLTNPVNGSNVLLVTLKFEAISEGTAPLWFDYNPDDLDITVDTNVVTHTAEYVDDVLASATTSTVMVGDQTCLWKYCGDADCDGKVDIFDFTYYADMFNGVPFPQPTPPAKEMSADFDGNGDINIYDFSFYANGMNNWGVACAETPHTN